MAPERPPGGISDMPEEEGNPLSHFCCFLCSVFQKTTGLLTRYCKGLGVAFLLFLTPGLCLSRQPAACFSAGGPASPSMPWALLTETLGYALWVCFLAFSSPGLGEPCGEAIGISRLWKTWSGRRLLRWTECFCYRVLVSQSQRMNLCDSILWPGEGETQSSGVTTPAFCIVVL